MVVLTAEEKMRLAEYLHEQAASTHDLVEQLTKLPGAPEAVVKKYRAEALALDIAARYIAKWETA